MGRCEYFKLHANPGAFRRRSRYVTAAARLPARFEAEAEATAAAAISLLTAPSLVHSDFHLNKIAHFTQPGSTAGRRTIRRTSGLSNHSSLPVQNTLKFRRILLRNRTNNIGASPIASTTVVRPARSLSTETTSDSGYSRKGFQSHKTLRQFGSTFAHTTTSTARSSAQGSNITLHTAFSY